MNGAGSAPGQSGSPGDPQIAVAAEERTFAELAAAAIRAAIRSATQAGRVAEVALSGGSTPLGSYRLLAEDADQLRPARFWFADERCVPADHEDSNYGAIAAILGAGEAAGDHRPELMRMRGELGPQAGAKHYEGLLLECLPAAPLPPEDRQAGALPRLDLVVLGIGPEGHIASLFPEAAALNCPPGQACVGVQDSPKPPPQRISLTMQMLKAAGQCLLLAAGQSKAAALAQALGPPRAAAPASLLERGRLSVIADTAAAALLPTGLAGPENAIEHR